MSKVSLGRYQSMFNIESLATRVEAHTFYLRKATELMFAQRDSAIPTDEIENRKSEAKEIALSLMIKDRIKEINEAFKTPQGVNSEKAMYCVKMLKHALITSIPDYKRTSSEEKFLDKNSHYKGYVLNNFIERREREKKGYGIIETREFKDMSFANEITEFKHYMDIPSSKMHEVSFGTKNPFTLLAELSEIEADWRERNRRFVEEAGIRMMDLSEPGDDREVAIFDLLESSSEIEANAMGHCGNGSVKDNGQRILSIREKCDDGRWKPIVTILLNEYDGDPNNHDAVIGGGVTGEIKGKFNEKPDEKDWKYIVKFLKSDFVDRMSLDHTYLPENNFQISDLPLSEQKEIYAEKPQLLHINSRALLVDELTEKECQEFEAENYVPISRDKTVTVMEWGIDDIMDEFNFDDLRASVMRHMSGDHIDYYNDYFDDNSYDFDEMLEHIDDKDIQGLAEYIEREFPGSFEEEELDPSDAKDVYKMAKYLELEEITDAFRNASIEGDRIGAENAEYEWMNQSIDDVVEELESAGFKVEFTNPSYRFDGNMKISIYLNRLHEEYQSYADEYSPENYEVLARETMAHSVNEPSPPYYGFSGFCAESAAAYFSDLFTELDLTYSYDKEDEYVYDVSSSQVNILESKNDNARKDFESKLSSDNTFTA